MRSKAEKGGGSFEGIKLLLCENPLPPLDEAIEAATAELPRSNYYTEAHSEPLRQFIAQSFNIDENHIHINAGSEIILRQVFDRFGHNVHLITPTYDLFPEISRNYTETTLDPANDFRFDLNHLEIPFGTSLAVIVNPNNPNGLSFDVSRLPELLKGNPDTVFLVDEAFIGLSGESVINLVPEYHNLIVTRTMSKAHSLAGFRVGYSVSSIALADDLNKNNDAYPLARASEAAALATLRNEDNILKRASMLRKWTKELASGLDELGIRTFPTETYFFLADFAPHDATILSKQLRERGILVKPLNNKRLGPGFVRVTTSLPEDNMKFLSVLKEVL